MTDDEAGVISANANKSFAQSVIVAWQRMTPDDTEAPDGRPAAQDAAPQARRMNFAASQPSGTSNAR